MALFVNRGAEMNNVGFVEIPSLLVGAGHPTQRQWFGGTTEVGDGIEVTRSSEAQTLLPVSRASRRGIHPRFGTSKTSNDSNRAPAARPKACVWWLGLSLQHRWHFGSIHTTGRRD